MNVYAISDTHGAYALPRNDCDLFIIAGDLAANSDIQNQEKILNHWKYLLEGSTYPTILVPGNHDTIFLEPDFKLDWCTVLIDEMVAIAGLTIYGCPWTKRFGKSRAFMLSDEELPTKYCQIPEGQTDILVTHGPRYGLLDQDKFGEHLGSRNFNDQHRFYQLHIHGHIHQSRGFIHYPTDHSEREFLIANVSYCDDDYVPYQRPMSKFIFNEGVLERAL